MMAGESKSEVQEVVISEDSNSQDAISERIVRRKSPQNSKSRLPSVNVPERIVLCLDVTPSCSKILLHPDKSVETLLILKQCVLIFINNKLSWSPKSEISIILLNGANAFLYVPFSNDKKKLIEKVKRIHVPDGEGDSRMEDDDDTDYCLDNLFQVISDSITLPKRDNINILPSHIVRCVFFYGRSSLLSLDSSREYFEELFSSPYFTFDSIFLYNSDLNELIRSEVLKVLTLLDKGYSYVIQSENNVINFMNKFSLLVSHPLQRPHQSELCSDIAIYRNKVNHS